MTFAVIHTGGKQYKVSANDTLRLEKLSLEEGQIVNFNEVLLTDKDSNVEIGSPLLEGAKVEGKIVKQTKNRTVIAFTKRRRQNSRRKKGHRQKISVVQIMKIFGKDGKLLSEATVEAKNPKVEKNKDKIETVNK
jgi:large subunit ribosomal protein L21